MDVAHCFRPMRTLLSIAIASAVVFNSLGANGQSDGNELDCGKILQFPQSKVRTAALELLPTDFQKNPTPGLRHLVDVALGSTRKEIDGQTVFFIGLEKLDPHKFARENSIVASQFVHLPQDYITTQEMVALRPQVERLGFEKIFESSYRIPFLKTYPIPRVRLEGYTQTLAVTAEGYPVLLEKIPMGRNVESLDERASLAFILAGLKRLSDNRVLPTLLGLTKTEEGALEAVFPLPAGYESSQMTSLRIGLQIANGVRGKVAEPLEQENQRIQPFESLIDRLNESQWPMLDYSLDLAAIIKRRPDLNLSRVLDLLKMPLWEADGRLAQDPYFYPNYFAGANSAWFPVLFNQALTTLRGQSGQPESIQLTTLSTDRSIPMTQRMVHLSLQPIDPISKFGRITLLRFEFFNSLLHGRAKFNYLNWLYSKSPEGQNSLLELVEYLAAPLKLEHLGTFNSNYRAKRFRQDFKVIEGSGK